MGIFNNLLDKMNLVEENESKTVSFADSAHKDDNMALHLNTKNCYVNISGEFDLTELNRISVSIQNALGEDSNVIFENITPGGNQHVQLVMELDDKPCSTNIHDVEFTAYSRKLLRDLCRIKEELKIGKQSEAIQEIEELIQETRSDIG